MGGGNLCAVIPRKPGDLAACNVRQLEEAVHVNLVLRTDDLAIRAAFFRIEPRWSIIDPGAPAANSMSWRWTYVGPSVRHGSPGCVAGLRWAMRPATISGRWNGGPWCCAVAL